MKLKRMIKRFILLWASLLSLAGFSKKKDESAMDDAILFPNQEKKMIVEDYEISAYHNQS
jgi:hypothetical protein